MRTTTALRTLAAALLTSGILAVTSAGTTATAAPPTLARGHGGGAGAFGGFGFWTPGVVVAPGWLDVRQLPTPVSPVVNRLLPGFQDSVQCVVLGPSFNGNPYWYWLSGVRAWAPAGFVYTYGLRVPYC
ncbi:SH3 domain-containing protein [Streptomyces sp. NPDC059378]|uniref:SH3 domain-containing protein n=1 Tax=Streptomyces sp. NPDC059378 TaxID=3346815 RepID=UPI0036B63624